LSVTIGCMLTVMEDYSEPHDIRQAVSSTYARDIRHLARIRQLQLWRFRLWGVRLGSFSLPHAFIIGPPTVLVNAMARILCSLGAFCSAPLCVSSASVFSPDCRTYFPHVCDVFSEPIQGQISMS
jgi:hypothetical protein